MDIEKQYVSAGYRPRGFVRILAFIIAGFGAVYGFFAVIQAFSPWAGAAFGQAAYLPLSFPTEQLSLPANNVTEADVASPITWVTTWAKLPDSVFGLFIVHTWVVALSALALAVIGVWLAVQFGLGRSTWAKASKLVGVAGVIWFVSSIAAQLMLRQVSDVASAHLLTRGWLEPGTFALLDGGIVLVGLLLIVAAVIMRSAGRHAAEAEGVV